MPIPDEEYLDMLKYDIIPRISDMVAKERKHHNKLKRQLAKAKKGLVVFGIQLFPPNMKSVNMIRGYEASSFDRLQHYESRLIEYQNYEKKMRSQIK